MNKNNEQFSGKCNVMRNIYFSQFLLKVVLGVVALSIKSNASIVKVVGGLNGHLPHDGPFSWAVCQM